MMLKPLMAAFAGFVLAAATGCCTTTYTVSASATSPDAALLARDVASDVRGRLAQRGYAVCANDAARGSHVTRVNLSLDRRETARLDVWRTYEGKATARVVSRGTVLGERTFSALGPRADNEPDAQLALREQLVAQIADWVLTVLPPPES